MKIPSSRTWCGDFIRLTRCVFDHVVCTEADLITGRQRVDPFRD